ncbi:MAG: S-layer homology domain-containing protein, partial [Acidimicrobiaceae bacterium]|nr:S-layer homology domain-containing protein [Acidimicrobiaceae bacterium]
NPPPPRWLQLNRSVVSSLLALHRRWSVLWWCVGVVSLLAAAPPAGSVAGFGDVADGQYYTEAVQWSADNDIAGTDGNCFAPGTVVTRGEASVHMWNMQGNPAAPAHSFDDITVGGQDAAVSWMLHNEITTGTSPTEFSPDTALTRAHLVTFLWRLAGEPSAPAHSFNDVQAPWQQGSVSWAADREITTGTSPTTFSPDTALTRAHLVTFLYRYQNQPTVTIDPSSPHCGTFRSVSAGVQHSCGVKTDNTITCWGDSWRGQTDAPDGEFTTVSAGRQHSCGVKTDNTVTCWGDSWLGEADAPDGEFKSVSAGRNHSCGVKTDNTVTCWGSRKQVDAPDGEFKSVSAGSKHSCGVRTDNTIACWGAWVR